MARYYPPYRPPHTIGGETNQRGEKRGARTARPPVGLAPASLPSAAGHDFGAFERFKQMNQDLQASHAPVVAPQPSAPDAFRTAATHAATRVGAAGIGDAAANPIPRPPAPVAAPVARPVAPAGVPQPGSMMANEIPGRFTDTGGVEHSYTTAGGVQERGYDPTKDQGHPGVTAVDPFNRNNWTRQVAIDPRYGGGVGTANNGAGYVPPSPGNAAGHAARTVVDAGNTVADRTAGAFYTALRAPKPVPQAAPVQQPATYNAGAALGAAPAKLVSGVANLASNAAQGTDNFLTGVAHGMAPSTEQAGRDLSAFGRIGNIVRPSPSAPARDSVLRPLPPEIQAASDSIMANPPRAMTDEERKRLAAQRIGQM